MRYNTLVKLSVSLIASALLSGCESMAQEKEVTLSDGAEVLTDAVMNCGCTNSSCRSDVTITYGVNNSDDSLLKVKEKAEVKKEQLALVFKLDPKNGPQNYDTSLVTIAGKPAAGNRNFWIAQTSGRYDPEGEIVICVPTTIAKGEYHYTIDVDGFGKLDPRVDVDR